MHLRRFSVIAMNLKVCGIKMRNSMAGTLGDTAIGMQ